MTKQKRNRRVRTPQLPDSNCTRTGAWVGRWQLVYLSQTSVYMPCALGSLFFHFCSYYFWTSEPDTRFNASSDWQLLHRQPWGYKMWFATRLIRMYGAQYPDVAAVGWDVFMSAISACSWAVIAPVSTPGMLRSTFWPTTQPLEKATEQDYRLLQSVTRHVKFTPITLGLEHDGLVPGRARASATQLRPSTPNPPPDEARPRPWTPASDDPRLDASGAGAVGSMTPGSSTFSSPGKHGTPGTSIGIPSPAKPRISDSSAGKSRTTGLSLPRPSVELLPRNQSAAAGEAPAVPERRGAEAEPVSLEEMLRRIEQYEPLYVPVNDDGWIMLIGRCAILAVAAVSGGLGFVNAAVHGGGLPLSWLR